MKNTLLKAITEAGIILKDNFAGNFKIESKDIIANLVTEIDKKSEQKIIEVIKNDFPEHNILSEEIGALTQESNYKWIIDPIDGTVNYAHSIPITCISIGIEKDGEVIMGAVYNPMMDELFFAEKGEGSYFNEKRIHVSKEDNFAKALLVTGFPYDSSRNPHKPVDVFGRIVYHDIPVRRLGSAALDLCWTAMGRFEGFWEYNLNAWDVAAGCIILTEAGGKLTDFNGSPLSIYQREILATNGLIHEQLRKLIKNEN
ncbi:MAG: inositol monophosphatase [Ignavibacteria bacterium]|nr:inositol monophosphatase [Ignavibacteria bacterium]